MGELGNRIVFVEQREGGLVVAFQDGHVIFYTGSLLHELIGCGDDVRELQRSELEAEDLLKLFEWNAKDTFKN
jgi:hypothetical protein